VIPGPSTASIVLDLPARADSLLALRATVAVLGALAGLTLDDIDDCEIAAEEAGAAALAASPRRIRIDVQVSEGVLRAGVGPEDAGGPWPPAGLTTGLPWRILEGVAEDVALAADGRIRFTKSTTA
jgi:anti-sigma regulatory factor (Ser/Thr protein kinase)